MHQLLRLMYVDQVTPQDKIFINERFDKNIVKETIGDLLCGVSDSGLYELQIRKEEIKKEISHLSGQLKSLKEVVASVSDELSMEQLADKRSRLIEERSALYKKADEIKEDHVTSSNDSEDSKSRLQSLRENIKTVNEQLAKTKNKIEKIKFGITDSEEYIESLKRRKEALQEAASFRSQVGGIKFEVCPACYSKLDVPTSEEVCHLCKSSLSKENPDESHKLKREQEIEIQIEESELLQEKRFERLQELQIRLPALINRQEDLQSRFDSIISSVGSSSDKKVESVYQRVGYINRQVEDIDSKMEVFKKIKHLSKRKDNLVSEMDSVQNEIDIRIKKRRKRRNKSYSSIQKNVKELLKKDLQREEVFQNPSSVSFDFAEDEVLVDGRNNYSASSKVILKNSFHLALFEASLQHEYFRYPRFVLFDNIEDKGMEDERSHNFQEVVAELSQGYSVSHQIIMTTSKISPKLEDSDHVVGPFYTEDNHTLDL